MGQSIWVSGWSNVINRNLLFLIIGAGDFLVHHATTLGLHTTTLILVKGASDARGPKLMPNKRDFYYSFVDTKFFFNLKSTIIFILIFTYFQ